jgi:orotate phosphoribosyltransferase
MLSLNFMRSTRQELLRLLAQKSFRLGNFKLSSGATSDYYIDCRTTTLDAKGARLTGEVFFEEIKRHGWKPDAVGGLTMGADPIVVAVSVVSGKLNGFLVRKTEKQHGTGQRIEGFREKGARVVIVDDVCTTGASTVQAIEAAREFGFEVVGAMCLVEREEAKGRPSVEKAAAPAPFVSIFTANDVRAEHIRQNHDTEPITIPTVFAVAASCEVCGRPAVTNNPRNLCAAHRM